MNKDIKDTGRASAAIEHDTVLATGVKKLRIAWNRGKRKPIEEFGELYCNCKFPKLTSNYHGRGQASCLLCGYPWDH